MTPSLVAVALASSWREPGHYHSTTPTAIEGKRKSTREHFLSGPIVLWVARTVLSGRLATLSCLAKRPAPLTLICSRTAHLLSPTLFRLKQETLVSSPSAATRQPLRFTAEP